MATNDGGPAFPHKRYVGLNNDGPMFNFEPGMSLRDWFAGQALAGLISTSHERAVSDLDWPARAYQVADAMLSARKGGE